LNEDCRKVIHLDDQTHWDFEDTVKCMKCGQEIDVVVKDGHLTSTHKHDET
jgi:hypothetical protein